MSSLVETLQQLQNDLVLNPIRIAAHSDMPFAIFQYPPKDEYLLRKHLRLLAISLKQEHNKNVTFISLAKIVWEAISTCDEKETLFKTESIRGFEAAQNHFNQIIDSEEFCPAVNLILDRISDLSSDKDIAFLVRAGGLAPYIYRTSLLLDKLQYQTQLPIILFYPGSLGEGSDLRFYDLPTLKDLGAYNYRTKIYGVTA